MSDKPSYEELAERVEILERSLADQRTHNAAARLQEQYLQGILDNTNIPIFLKDKEYRYLLVNREFERILAAKSRDVLGRNDYEIFSRPVADLFRSQDEEVCQRRTLVKFIETLELADGTQTFITSKFPLFDDHDDIYAIGGVCTDITELLQVQRDLETSEKKLRTLIETAPLGIQISDRNGRIIMSNPAHHKILGIPAGRIVGMNIWDFVQDDDEKKVLQKFYTSLFADQPEPKPYTVVNRTADGRAVHLQVDWSYMRDDKNEIYALCSFINDISERVAAEEAVKASEQKFRSVLESCPEGVHLFTLKTDNSLIFSGANPAADTILNLDHSRLVGQKIEEAFPAIRDTEIPDRFRETCRHGTSWRTEQLVYKRKKMVRTYAFTAFQTEPDRMAVFFQDITEKCRMEEEVLKIQKLESVGVLAGGIAHDFNNLLTAILGNISMARLFVRTDPLKVEERLEDAEKATIRSRDLTQQLLTFAKGGAPVKSAALIQDIINDSSSFMLSGSNVKCSLNIAEDVWPVDMDVGQISQVIQNLVKNADQAMPDGGTITINVDNILIDEGGSIPLPRGKYVHIQISDQGIGIPKKHLARIFDPYFSTKQDGNGLGLAASYSIIKNHDGLITCESGDEGGCTFHMYLPTAAQKPAVTIIHRDRSRRSGEKILIMDDDNDVLQVAVKMLQLMGYKTDSAHDGREAITKYEKAISAGDPFDGVLLDLTIPGGMGGKETLQQLLVLDAEVKAIVSSGYANDPILADYSAHGFQGVVTKPYDMEQLGQALHNLFA